ncbi:YjgB family protein [Paenibacillus sepulcri]|uniref:YjgB family protein n=1 Tax=Paenibacillus sepulcri TaxID=359917 RepID=A0ABS7C7T9_9BACL|nr:YjgB family protein [Paenibacillus sepulcri]
MYNIKKTTLQKWTKLSLAAIISVSSITAAAQIANAKAASTQSISSSTVKNSSSAYVKSLYALAKQGKIPGSDFVSGKTLIKDVHKKWGDPTLGPSNKYEFYNFGMGTGSFAVGVGKGGVVFDLRTFGQNIDPTTGIKSLTFTSIISALGMPKEVRFSGEDKIYMYNAGSFQLKFVGPKSVAKGSIAHIDHMNVYSPKADK